MPRFYKGKRIGEVRRYDNRLAMFLMSFHDPRRRAAAAPRGLAQNLLARWVRRGKRRAG